MPKRVVWKIVNGQRVFSTKKITPAAPTLAAIKPVAPATMKKAQKLKPSASELNLKRASKFKVTIFALEKAIFETKTRDPVLCAELITKHDKVCAELNKLLKEMNYKDTKTAMDVSKAAAKKNRDKLAQEQIDFARNKVE